MAGANAKITPTPALRVSQLDAAELDNEVISLIKLQLSKSFKYHQKSKMAAMDSDLADTFTTSSQKLLHGLSPDLSQLFLSSFNLHWSYIKMKDITSSGKKVDFCVHGAHIVPTSLLLTNFLVNYDAEISALLKYTVWKFTVAVHESTIGQSLLNLRYFTNHGNQSFQFISRRQKNMYALIVIVCPWLRERSADILRFFGLSNWKEKTQRLLQWTETALKVASLINFMVFLQQGVYHSITERILGIRPMFPDKQGIRQVSFEYMTRELLWHGFSEFLFFILPFVNFQRIKNFLLRKILPAKQGQLLDPSKRPLTKCAICGEWPVNPQEIGCQHVYCYFCIKSNFKADPGYCCPLCNMNVSSDDTIQSFRFTVPPR